VGTVLGFLTACVVLATGFRDCADDFADFDLADDFPDDLADDGFSDCFAEARVVLFGLVSAPLSYSGPLASSDRESPPSASDGLRTYAMSLFVVVPVCTWNTPLDDRNMPELQIITPNIFDKNTPCISYF
jgi:hypothetical protein